MFHVEQFLGAAGSLLWAHRKQMFLPLKTHRLARLGFGKHAITAMFHVEHCGYFDKIGVRGFILRKQYVIMKPIEQNILFFEKTEPFFEKSEGNAAKPTKKSLEKVDFNATAAQKEPDGRGKPPLFPGKTPKRRRFLPKTVKSSACRRQAKEELFWQK